MARASAIAVFVKYTRRHGTYMPKDQTSLRLEYMPSSSVSGAHRRPTETSLIVVDETFVLTYVSLSYTSRAKPAKGRKEEKAISILFASTSVCVWRVC
jgi:hypothetical protein